jgi:hypothetical protein
MAAADTEPLKEALRRHMPKAHGEVLNFAACMFTMTPDNHFVIDTHPQHPQVSGVEFVMKVLQLPAAAAAAAMLGIAISTV